MMKKIRDSLLYSFHVIFHPFDGFWCAQREGRGNVWAATILVVLCTLTNILSSQCTGYIFKTNLDNEFNLLSELLGVIVPVLLFCIANWSITTLMDGEGKFRDIYVMTAYALTPMILVEIPRLLLSHVIVTEEAKIYSALGVLAVVWTGFLLFGGLMTIHQLSAAKTVLTVLITIVAMAVILFLFLLFFALIQQLINFAYVFYKELSLRLY